MHSVQLFGPFLFAGLALACSEPAIPPFDVDAGGNGGSGGGGSGG